MLETARFLLEKQRGCKNLELICGEAVNVPTEIRYDAVFSVGVFSYFPDYEYAKMVLEKMLEKSKRNIAIIGTPYDRKKDDFLAYRHSIIKDYDERYKDLPKLFYSKQFFMDFAEAHDVDIKFNNSRISGYRNNPYVFDCYMYRADQ